MFTRYGKGWPVLPVWLGVGQKYPASELEGRGPYDGSAYIAMAPEKHLVKGIFNSHS